MKTKVFRLGKSDIAPIAMGYGGCIATDRIVVDGCAIGYMYKETPANSDDSGWRFFSGDEDEDYMADLANHGVYDVNTIANYDPSIVPHLDAECGSAFEKSEDGLFVLIV